MLLNSENSDMYVYVCVRVSGFVHAHFSIRGCEDYMSVVVGVLKSLVLLAG